MEKQKTTKIKFILIIFLTLALAVCALGLVSVKKAKGATTVTPNLVLPNSNLEYQELINPIDAYYDDNLTAVLQANELFVYKNGTITQITNSNNTPISAVKQIKCLNANTLIISSAGRLLQVDLNDVSAFTELNFDALINSSGAYFDFNDGYFVLSYGDKLTIYNFANGTVSTEKMSLPSSQDTPLAINSLDQVFYVNNEHKLQKQTIEGASELLSNTPLSSNPETFIANNEYLYYLLGTEIYRISVEGGNPQLLTKPTSKYDLGKIITPISISFKGENLIVTGDNAVQEFRVTEDNKLEFTGFAIAKDKSAYNRIDKSVKEIEREKDTLATLDNNNLTLINIAGEFNAYNPNNFINRYPISKLTNEGQLQNPHSFALGSNSVLLLYNYTNNPDDKLGILTFDNGALNTDINLNVKDYTDLSYQSGKYYVLAHENNTSTTVFVSDENSIEFTTYVNCDKYAEIMEVDVFGNVFLYDNDKVYKYKTANNNLEEVGALTNVKKLETDLGGNLFALTSNAVYYFNGTAFEKFDIANYNASGLKSFALDYDKKDVFMVCENEELIVKTSALSNVSIDKIVRPNDYKLTQTNANANLQIAEVNQNANVYSVSENEQVFAFNDLVIEPSEYALICEFNQDGVQLYALAGRNKDGSKNVVLVNQNDAVIKTADKILDIPEKAYITTSVNGYYFPIITDNSDYALTDGDTTIRLEKEQVINPKHKVVFLEKEFYFAEFSIGEKTYSGYIPIEYTIEILSQDFKWDNYKAEKVSKTTVYQEKELINAILELENDTDIRLISIENDVAYIAVTTSEGYIKGYIDASAIIDNSSVAIRNILIILAVMASVCGTTSYFILRKKK